MTRRRLRFAVAAALGAVAALLLVRAGSADRAREARLLAEAVARLDASDPNWRLDDLLAEYNRSLPPPDQNAGEFVRAVVARMSEPLPGSWPKLIPPGPAAPNRLGADPDGAALAKLHAVHAAVIAELRGARHFAGTGFVLGPGTWSPYTPGYSAFEPMHAARTLLLLDAAVSGERGDAGSALQSCAALASLADPEPGHVVGGMYEPCRAAVAAERALALAGADPPDAVLGEAQAKFAAARSREFLRGFYRFSRAKWLLVIDRIESGEDSPANWLGVPAGTPKLAARAYFGRLTSELPRLRRLVIEHHEKLLAAAELPDSERYAAEDALNTWKPGGVVVGRPGAEFFVNQHLPIGPTWRWDREGHGVRALCSCAEVAVACERFRLRADRFPASLSELPAGLLAVVPADPFTGKPLLYSVRPDGATVYSAGPDGADDGGTPDPAGERLTPAAGADIVFRLWNPDQRRQSP